MAQGAGVDSQIRLLETAKLELHSLKPDRAVYQRRGSLLLRTTARAAQQRVEQQLAEAKLKAFHK